MQYLQKPLQEWKGLCYFTCCVCVSCDLLTTNYTKYKNECFQHFLFILLWLILQCCSNCFIDNLLNSWWHIDFILFFPWANAQHSILDKQCMVLSLGETVHPLCAHKSLRRACLKNSVFFISHQAKGEWLWERTLGFAVYPTLWVGALLTPLGWLQNAN